MDHTYLDLFNYYMKQFLNHVNANFPGTKSNILVHYRPLLEGRDNKSDTYAKMFLTVANMHIDAIVARDATALFQDGENGHYGFIQGVNFRELWLSDHNTEEVQANNWRFLQLLLRLSRAIIPSREEVRTLLQEVSDGQISAPAKLEATLYDAEAEEDDDEEGTVGAPDIFGLGNLAGLANLAGFGNGEAPDLSSLLKMGADMLGNMGISEDQMAAAAQAMGANGEADIPVDAGDNNVTSAQAEPNDATEGVTSDTGAQAETSDATATMPNPLEAMASNEKVMSFVEKMKADMDAAGVDENNPMAVFQHMAKAGFSPENMPELLDVSKEVLGGLGGNLGGLMQSMMGGGNKAGPSRKQRRNAARRSEQMVGRRGAGSTTRERLRARAEANQRAREEAESVPRVEKSGEN